MSAIAATKKRRMTRFSAVSKLERVVLANGSEFTTYKEFKAESEDEQLRYLRWLYSNGGWEASFLPLISELKP